MCGCIVISWDHESIIAIRANIRGYVYRKAASVSAVLPYMEEVRLASLHLFCIISINNFFALMRDL